MSSQSIEVIPQLVSSEPLVDMAEALNFSSIYIPTIPNDLMLAGRPFLDEAAIKHFFEVLFPLGTVKRVDIANRPHRNGGEVRCAFVHFDQWSVYAEPFRMQLVKEDSVRLYGPHSLTKFYSSMNRSFQRYITVKINKAPILEVSPIEAEQMNIHQLVDNYKRLQAQLDEKDKKIQELEQHIKDIHVLDLGRNDYIADLEYRLRCAENASDLDKYRLEYIAELEYKLACALHAGEDQVRDGGRMSVDELSALDNV
jgi:hypothetical protein